MPDRPEQLSLAGTLPAELLIAIFTSALQTTPTPFGRLALRTSFQLTCLSWVSATQGLPPTEIAAAGERAVGRLVREWTLWRWRSIKRVTIDFGDLVDWSTSSSVQLGMMRDLGRQGRRTAAEVREWGELESLEIIITFGRERPPQEYLDLVKNIMAKEVVLRVEPVGGDAPLMDVMEIADSMSSATEVGLFGMDVFIAPPLPGTVAPPEPPYKALTSFSTDLHTKDVHSFVHLLQESTDSLRTLSFVGGDEPFSPPLRLLPQLFVSFSGLTSFTFYSNRWDIFGHGALSFDNILRHAHSLEYLALGYTGYSPAILRTIEMHIPKLRVLHLKLFFEVPRVLSEWIEAAAAPELEELKLGSMMREWGGWSGLREVAEREEIRLEAFEEGE